MMARSEISPSAGTRRRTAFSPPPPPDSGHRDPARHPHRPTAPSSQTALFHSAAPPLLFAVLLSGLLIELRTRLAPPPPMPLPVPGIITSVRGSTAAQSALIWAEARWPGVWALPVLCVGALGALRAAIWTGATLVEGLGAVRGAADDGVRVGRWEDGGSVSGSDLLTGVFT